MGALFGASGAPQLTIVRIRLLNQRLGGLLTMF